MIVTSIIALLAGGVLQADAAKTTPKPVRKSTPLTATGTFSDGMTRIFDVTAGDLDGDGAPDAMELHVTCDGPSVSSASVRRYAPGQPVYGNLTVGNNRVKAPRDVATGQSSGKRQHKPYTMSTTDPTPMQGVTLATTYDVKTMKGGRMMSSTPTKVSLSDVSPAVCGPH